MNSISSAESAEITPAEKHADDLPICRSTLAFPLCIVPTSPALVAQLAPADTASGRIRHRVREILRMLVDTTRESGTPVTEIVLVGSQDPRWRTEHRGNFRAWGAPEIQLADGHYLAELVLRYLCNELEPLITASYGSLQEFAAHQHELGTLVLMGIDGSAGLSQSAPLAELPTASHAHQWSQALLGGNTSGPGFATHPNSEQLSRAGVWEPELWLEIAQLKAAGGITSLHLHDLDTTHGVARYIATGLIEPAAVLNRFFQQEF